MLDAPSPEVEAVMMIPDEIRAAKELAEKATDPPWFADEIRIMLVEADTASPLRLERRNEDAAFIANSRGLVPRLCDTAEALYAERDVATAVVREIKTAIEAARELYSSAGPLAVSVGGLLAKIGALLKDKSNV